MAISSFARHGSVNNHLFSSSIHHFKFSLSSSVKPLFKELQKLAMKIDVSRTIKITSTRTIDAFVDSVFEFVNQPLLPSQSNFAPVEEIGEAAEVVCCDGEIPTDFPEGVFIRNGPNPVFGGLKTAVSIFGRSSHTWVEGEGMLHAVYFEKNNNGDWTISYRNRYVESKTLKMEKKRKKPSFIPALEGNSAAVVAASLINRLRFGTINKLLSNTSVFEHSGRLYAVSENHQPQEFDISTLETLNNWDVNGAWDRPFTSHPKKAPNSGELVAMGIDANKPYYVLGVISADGKKMLSKVDLNFNRSVLSHDVGVTEKYNVIIDHALVIDTKRLLHGGPLMKYDKGGYARIGVMPRYGDADSVHWFDVQPHCTFHILNCFDDCDEVVVRGCRALNSMIPGPDYGLNKFEWFSKGFNFTKRNDEEDGYLFTHLHEWRLNMVSGKVEEKNLTSTDFSMDFPFINGDFTGVKYRYGYTQLINSNASSSCGMSKYGGLAKLYFDETSASKMEKVEYHIFEDGIFCTGSAFVCKHGGAEEDDGWIISYVHNEEADISQVYVIDAKKFESKPVAKLTLPERVPYGFHGTFIPMPLQPLCN